MYNIYVNRTDNGALDELVKSPPFQGGNYGFESRMDYTVSLARDSTMRTMVRGKWVANHRRSPNVFVFSAYLGSCKVQWSGRRNNTKAMMLSIVINVESDT